VARPTRGRRAPRGGAHRREPRRRARSARMGRGRSRWGRARVVRAALRSGPGMSGIAALYEKNGAPAEEALASAMLGRLLRRGPDRNGLYVDGSVALAQCMLETTPEDERERQPYRSPSVDLWIVADARIDNRDDLLRFHEGGRDGREVPDSALILEA